MASLPSIAAALAKEMQHNIFDNTRTDMLVVEMLNKY